MSEENWSRNDVVRNMSTLNSDHNNDDLSRDEPSQTQLQNNAQNQDNSTDLIGVPYAVIESDPGIAARTAPSTLFFSEVILAVFTALMQNLGVFGLEAQEVFSLEFLDPTFRLATVPLVPKAQTEQE